MQFAPAKLRQWRQDPLTFVREVFGAEPDPWQEEALREFPRSQRLAMKACKGPGKTCVLAWLCWNFLLTRPHPKIIATSITGDNLADGLWTEMSTWQKRAKDNILAPFKWTATKVFLAEHPETHYMVARQWSKSANPEAQADTLAGKHADYMLFVLDEVGGIPDAVMAAAEAALASGVECHLLMAGNPTHLEGPLYRACTTERHLWRLIEITGDPDNPKRSTRVSVQWAREQIQKYGRENPWVMVNVLGMFPPASINALLGPDDVSEAMGRHVKEDAYAFAPRVIGVDVARFGDDRTVFMPRQGIVTFNPVVLRNQRTEEIAARLSVAHQRFDADAVFIDDTGGYGAGVIDAALQLGLTVIPVSFSGKAFDPRYYNKRAEMHFEAAEWVKRGGVLPNRSTLQRELIAASKYTLKGDKLIMIEKDVIKEELGVSPDENDAFVITFAAPVMPKPRGVARLIHGDAEQRALHEWNPFEGEKV